MLCAQFRTKLHPNNFRFVHEVYGLLEDHNEIRVADQKNYPFRAKDFINNDNSRLIIRVIGYVEGERLEVGESKTREYKSWVEPVRI